MSKPALDKISVHEREACQNSGIWKNKTLLQSIYKDFHAMIRQHLASENGSTLELGSGSSLIKETIPDCLTSDIFGGPGIDRVVSAYEMPFADDSLSNVILFDVFHHLERPVCALNEIRRTLIPGGRVVLFEPYISVAGAVVYGLLHQEPVGWKQAIDSSSEKVSTQCEKYYAAQGNATRIFFGKEIPECHAGFKIIKTQILSAPDYVLSGGFSKSAMYPARWRSILRHLGGVLDCAPRIFGTRCLIVLEKARIRFEGMSDNQSPGG